MVSRLTFSLLAFALGAVGAQAQSTPIAIINARIEIGDGQVIEQGTVILQGGKIVAVGASKAPDGATIVDAKGMVVYPGFIDAYSSRGLKIPAAPAAATPPDSRNTAPATMWHANRKGIRPELSAATSLDLGSQIADNLKQGVTTAHLAPGTGTLRGTTAVVDYLETGKVLRPAAGAELAFRGGAGTGYPGTIFAVVATLRQALADAKTYTMTPDAPKDPLWEPLRPVLSGELPAIFASDTARDIARVLRVADEFSLKVILAGGKEAYRDSARLKAKGIPVIVSLDLDSEPSVKPDDKPNSPPKQVLDERHDLWAERRGNAKALNDAGIPIAFGSLGASVSDFLPNVRKLIASGLPKDAALKALTSGGATILGVADQTGTIAVGKLANLVILSGDFADEKSEVRTVFVEGTRTDLKKEGTK